MIRVENVAVYNIARAVYSARNPLNSWAKSDSDLEKDIIGEKDLDLMKRLYKAGTEHRKYLRQIFVSMDITAPLYWLKELETYKVGTVSNSCSTMHTIHKKPFEMDDFSYEHLIDGAYEDSHGTVAKMESRAILGGMIGYLNYIRERYILTKDKDYWWQLIQLLPSSYNQRRTITMNYENVVTIIKQRTGHKLDEWNEFVKELEQLPYVKEIMDEGTD